MLETSFGIAQYRILSILNLIVVYELKDFFIENSHWQKFHLYSITATYRRWEKSPEIISEPFCILGGLISSCRCAVSHPAGIPPSTEHHPGLLVTISAGSNLVLCSPPSVSQSVFTIMEKAPTRVFSWSFMIIASGSRGPNFMSTYRGVNACLA